MSSSLVVALIVSVVIAAKQEESSVAFSVTRGTLFDSRKIHDSGESPNDKRR